MSGTLGRARAQTLFALLLTTGVNGVSGILIARALGTEGRGEITAILTATVTVSWAAALGGNQALVYWQARHPGDARRLLGTWLVLLVPLSVLGLVVGELLLSPILSAQSPEVLAMARLYMLTLVFSVLVDVATGLILGDQQFGFFNLLRVSQPVVVTTIYAGLALTGRLSVGAALVTTGTVGIGAAIAAAVFVVRRYGVGRPSLRLARATLSYGFRAHGHDLSGQANARLDLLVMPAILSATSVGLYGVATIVSGLVFSVATALVVLVVPVAAREGHTRGIRTVISAMQVTLMLATAGAVVVGVVAELAITTLYGTEFAGAVTAVRLLLPGTVLLAASAVLSAGLYALNRPLTAMVAQLAGTAVTVPGLVLFLARGGIEAAAIVSSLSYAVVFALSTVAYLKVSGASWADLACAPWWPGVRARVAGLRPRRAVL